MYYCENLYYDRYETSPLGLYCCGKRLDAPDHSFGPAARSYYWFILVLEGTGWYTLGKNTFRVTKDMLLVAFPDCRIHYWADKGSVWSIRWVSIAADATDNCLSAAGITPEHPILHPEQPAEIAYVMEELFCRIPEQTLRSALACSGLVYRLLSLLIPREMPISKRTPDYVQDALYFMRLNCDKSLRVSDIAAEIGIDRSYFSRLFREKMRISPIRWLLQYRLEKSRDLLRTTDLSIAETACSVGIADPLYFSKCFRQAYGTSPTEYRKAAEKEHYVFEGHRSE